VESFIHKESKGWCVQLINAAVLGSPISHSLSPLLHALAYEQLGLTARYESVEVKAGELSEYLAMTEKNCLSLTMPLKEEALAVADSISEIATRISCGNTLSFKDGGWNLTSTDVSGFDHALSTHKLEQIDSVLVIGAGATARAAVASVSQTAKEVLVISRNQERELAMNLASSGVVAYLPWQLTDRINSVDLVINTTPKFAADFFLPSIDNPRGTFFEVLYDPWPTAVSKVWSEAQARVIDGLDLLIHQAITQVEIFSGVTVDREFFYAKMRAAALLQLT